MINISPELNKSGKSSESLVDNQLTLLPYKKGIHNPECDTVLENYNLILFWLKIFIHKNRKKNIRNCNMEKFIEFLCQQAKMELLEAKLANLNNERIRKKWSILLNDSEDVESNGDRLLESWYKIKDKTLLYIGNVRKSYNAQYKQNIKMLL